MSGEAPNSVGDISKLPPKLRERLLKRGILKEEQVKAAGLEAGSTKASPPPGASEAAPQASPGTPPGTPPPEGSEAPPSVGATPCGASLPKTAAPAPVAGLGSLAVNVAADLDSMKEIRRQRWLAQQPVMGQQPSMLGTQPMAMMGQMLPPPIPDVQAAIAQAQAKAKAKAQPAQPTRTVFSSAPVLNKRPAENAAAEEEAKQARLDDSLSPAEARAAMAQVDSAETPTWTFPNAVNAQATTGQAAAAPGAITPKPPGGPPPGGPALPPGWVRVPHEGDFYYWNTTTDEVSWEHPGGPKAKKAETPVFTEELKCLHSDLGRLIGRQGLNLKIIKASIGADIKVPRSGKGKGKDKDSGKDAKGKGKSKKDKSEVIRGQGLGDKPIDEDQFAKIIVTAESAHIANGGKRCLQIMLGYGRSVERALQDLGVVAKMPSIDELDPKGKKEESKDKVDPMDPAAYSDTPQGGWSAGLKKATGGGGSGKFSSSQENAERF